MLYDLYAHKYANQTFDVIISTDDNALNFLREYHGEIFPNVPIVFCGVNNTKVPDLVDRNIFTGIMEIWAAKENVKLILALHPQTRQIVVINGNTPSSEYQWRKLKLAFSEFDNIDFKRLDSTFSMVEIKDYLRKLPKESVVLYSAIFRDKTGTYFGHKDTLERISKVNSRPIYGRSCSKSGRMPEKLKALDLPRLIVKDVMTRQISSCVDDDTIQTGIETLMEIKSSAILVTDINQYPVGVLSKTDLNRAFAHCVPLVDSVSKIMGRPIVTCSPFDTLLDTLQKMLLLNLKRLFVVEPEDGKATGVLSLSDAARFRSGTCRACSATRELPSLE